MSDKTSIEWTDATWNPIRAEHGRHICARISPGCDNCYASTMTKRFTGVEYGPEGQPLAVPATLDEKALALPLKWKEPRRIFVCSMTDLFGSWVTDDWLDRIFAVMALASQHTFQVLTKRPSRMAAYLSVMGTDSDAYRDRWDAARRWLQSVAPNRAEYIGVMMAHQQWPLPNVWLGTTIESDAYAWRSTVLSLIPAAVRFISAEPLLSDLPSLDLTGISWLISGGESGHGARPVHPDWVRDLRDRCQAAGVAFFHKQWGEYGSSAIYITDGQPAPHFQFMSMSDWVNHANRMHKGDVCIDRDGKRLHNGGDMKTAAYPAAVVRRVGTKAAGRLLDGRTWDEVPTGLAVRA